MSTGSEAAEQMTRETLRISETVAKLTATGAKNLGALLAALLKDNIKIKGKTNLNTMLKEGKELSVFPIEEAYLKQFYIEAKKYGILYSVIKDMKAIPPTFDILAKAEDVSKINRVFERISYPIPKDNDLKKTEKTILQENKSKTPKNGLSTKATDMKNKSVVEELKKVKQPISKRIEKVF